MLGEGRASVQDRRKTWWGTWRLGNLATRKSVQKLQTALHAKAKAEAGYRFYAVFDKISRDDILAHAYAQCRSNKGAPRIDGQDFADIEAYGVERWLAELALALRQETYRPEPIRRAFIPKANGKLRPLGISSVRDRVCMTQRCWCWSRSSKPTFHLNNMPTGRGGTPSRRRLRWRSGGSVVIRTSSTPTSRTTSGAFRGIDGVPIGTDCDQQQHRHRFARGAKEHAVAQ